MKPRNLLGLWRTRTTFMAYLDGQPTGEGARAEGPKGGTSVEARHVAGNVREPPDAARIVSTGEHAGIALRQGSRPPFMLLDVV